MAAGRALALRPRPGWQLGRAPRGRHLAELSAVYLRELEPADAEALLVLFVENREFLAPWEPVRPDSFFTLEAQEQALTRDRDSDTAFGFGIFLSGSDELVGRVRLNEIVRGVFQNAYLGYFVSERHNGRGYATEGVRQAVDAGFGPIGLHRIQAAVVPRNVGSVRVLEKVGFREEGLALRYLQINGVWEDHRLFAVTSEEWPRPS